LGAFLGHLLPNVCFPNSPPFPSSVSSPFHAGGFHLEFPVLYFLDFWELIFFLPRTCPLGSLGDLVFLTDLCLFPPPFPYPASLLNSLPPLTSRFPQLRDCSTSLFPYTSFPLRAAGFSPTSSFLVPQWFFLTFFRSFHLVSLVSFPHESASLESFPHFHDFLW